MIVNFQDFHFFPKKISNSLGSFDEVIFPYRASPEKNNNPSFRFAKPDKNKNPELDYYRTFDPRKILFNLPSQKVYLLKNQSAKRLIPGVIEDIKKA